MPATAPRSRAGSHLELRTTDDEVDLDRLRNHGSVKPCRSGRSGFQGGKIVQDWVLFNEIDVMSQILRDEAPNLLG